MRELERAVELDPKRATFRSNIGYALQLQGKHEAIASYREAIRLDDKLASAWIPTSPRSSRRTPPTRAEARTALEKARARSIPQDPRVVANFKGTPGGPREGVEEALISPPAGAPSPPRWPFLVDPSVHRRLAWRWASGVMARPGAAARWRSSMTVGRAKWFNDEKGWGFIKQDEGPDVFVHAEISCDGRRRLVEDELVEFEIKEGPRGSRR